MAYTIPHHASNSGSGTAASVTITSPTSGNLLIVYVFEQSGTSGNSLTNPSGWTREESFIHSISTGEDVNNWWRVSDGTESSFATTLTTTAPWCCLYLEIAGFSGTITRDLVDVASTLSGVTTQTNAGSSFTTNQPNEAVVSMWAWDPPEFGEYGWIDGVRIRIVRGAHSGGKSAGSFTTPSPYTQVDTTTSQVNAAGVSSWQTAATSGTSPNATETYSVSGPASGSYISFYGLITPVPSSPIQVVNAAIKRASTF